MNPPSAIHGAMGRERKPFTYTPGGLDLSEIKSERMAKRLMRNAMNQGVPEVPIQSIQSPSTPSTPMAVPNFNCLPVQVFPTFALPANPKSLLRTRSTPDPQRDQPPQKTPPSAQIVNNMKPSGMEHLRETMNNNTMYSSNNYRPLSMHEYGSIPRNNDSLMRTSYGNDAFTAPILPEISYDAEYLTAKAKNTVNIENKAFIASEPLEIDRKFPAIEGQENILSDFTIVPILKTDYVPVTKPEEINMRSDDDDDNQREVKVVKKQVKKEKKLENGEQNGDAEAEMTVKLPAKKSAAKTETQVEVVQKQLPDGSTEEIKTTTTKTTIDGKTEIKTKIETTIIPKPEEEEEEVEEEEEEEVEVVKSEEQEIEENSVVEIVKEPTEVKVTKTEPETSVKESSKVIQKEEKSETTTTTTKKVVVQQSNKAESESEIEEEEDEAEEAETVVVQKPPAVKPPEPPKHDLEAEEEEEEAVTESEDVVELKKPNPIVKPEEQEEEEEEEVIDEQVEVKSAKKDESLQEIPQTEKSEEEVEEVEDEEEFEEAVSESNEKPATTEKKVEVVIPVKKVEDDESEYTEEEIESEKEEVSKSTSVAKQEIKSEEETVKVEPKLDEKKEEHQEPTPVPTEPKAPLREPSIPLEKVEDVEIKPIGQGTVSRTHTESTEIITKSNEKPTGIQSTQTEYNRIENIVTVNRTTKTLDHSYEQLTQQGVPTVKTYFAPDRERVSTSPQPSRPYQPVYPPTQQPERRHSLLLERLSTERQMPSEIYQNNYPLNNQTYVQQQPWSQEPQSEVINVSNVKPSTITNQQWYQQSRKENVLFNNVLPATAPSVPTQQWNQPQPQSQYPTSHVENTSQETPRTSLNQQNAYPTFTLPPSNWATNNVSNAIPTINSQPNQYSLLNQNSSETYQKTTQQYSSSYVPPPWEQDSRYVAPELPTQNLYQAPCNTNTFSPDSKPGWKPTPPAGKFSKPPPTSYVPPAPNQSFVKSVSSVVEPPKLPGRKTYYSEYERRYITVPESTYIPRENKFQPQPDPSPQYYYDNNEPSEAVEPQWRRELREFTEKTTQCQTQQSNDVTTSVKPPWEEDAKYVKVPTVTYTPTPSWSQTLRPQTWRERSFESEYVGSKEWSKTNTLGRGRPLSSYGNVESTIPERPRGVSVDRYNPNNYQAPITTEYAPVQTHTHNPTPSPQAKGYHNPNVPAYHARTSAELREQAPIPQPRPWGLDTRATPIQSRSFKYLQWITGTED